MDQNSNCAKKGWDTGPALFNMTKTEALSDGAAPLKCQCFTLSVRTMSAELKVKNFVIAATTCAIIRKRLAKVSCSS